MTVINESLGHVFQWNLATNRSRENVCGAKWPLGDRQVALQGFGGLFELFVNRHDR